MRRLLSVLLVLCALCLLPVCTCQAERLTLPRDITAIEDYAFENCTQFTGELIIPTGVTYIGAHAFDGCTGFTGTVYVPEGAAVDETAFANTSLTVVVGVRPVTPDVTLIYAEINPIDTIAGRAAVAFKTKLEELSGGTVTVNVQASGVLGSEAQVLDGILMGSDVVDVVRLSAQALTNYGCAKAQLLNVPYTFSSREHFWAFANSELADEILLEPLTIGLPLRGLTYLEEGFRHFFARSELNDIGDLAGKKIRVAADPVMINMMISLGANPTTMSFTELYSALQVGVVDGSEQPIANYKSNAFSEVAPNLILDGHTIGAMQMLITDHAWNKLTEQQQAWVKEAAQYAADVNAEFSEAEEAETLAELRAAGVTITEVDDKTPWRTACASVINESITGQEELYQEILDLE